jgi:hypothetical protein
MKAAKAVVGLLVPLITALLIGFSTGEWDYEAIGYLAGSVVTGLLVYFVPNKPSQEPPHDPHLRA